MSVSNLKAQLAQAEADLATVRERIESLNGQIEQAETVDTAGANAVLKAIDNVREALAAIGNNRLPGIRAALRSNRDGGTRHRRDLIDAVCGRIDRRLGE